jgi:glycosyltransferase involved in cell wall biosynthesis
VELGEVIRSSEIDPPRPNPRTAGASKLEVRGPQPAQEAPPPLDLAIAGTRGVPARYGGFETAAEELGWRLAARGHRVTVYGRVPYVGETERLYRGVRVVPVAAPRGKHLETPLHTLASAWKAQGAGHDVVLLCNAANAFAAPLFRRGGAQVVLNLDGIERLRRKWGPLGRLWHTVGERLALRLADCPLADAAVIRDYYRRRHGRDLVTIPYGGDRCPPDVDVSAVRRWGLEPGGYVLTVGRLEPENNALLVAAAQRLWRAGTPLAVVGDAPYARAYKRRLYRLAGAGVVFTGGVYGADYFALQRGASCYVAAGEVGGTHPALLEAMACGGLVVANDVPEHREVLGECGLYYRPGDPAALARAVDQALDDPHHARALQTRALDRVEAHYGWEQVVDRYQELFYGLVRSPHSRTRMPR